MEDLTIVECLKITEKTLGFLHVEVISGSIEEHTKNVSEMAVVLEEARNIVLYALEGIINPSSEPFVKKNIGGSLL